MQKKKVAGFRLAVRTKSFMKPFLTITALVVIILSLSNNFYLIYKVSTISPLSLKVTSAQLYVCVDVAPPVLDSIGNLNATAGELFTFKVNATSPSGRQVYYYSNATIFNINVTNGWINFTPTLNDTGVYIINISASHNICAGIEDSEVINFTIEGNNPPEWLNNTPTNQSLTEDTLYYFNLSQWVTDADNDSIIFYSNNSFSEFPSFNLNQATGILNFTPNDPDVGLHYIKINASDNHDNASKVFRFNVSNINDVPILSNISLEFYLCEDIPFYYDVNASDDDLLIPNSSERLYFYDNTSLFVINENTGEISFAPTQSMEGYHPVRIYVTDEEAYDYNDTEFIIIPTNDAPVLGPIGAKTVWVNETLYFIANATDEEDGDNSGGNLNFSLNFINNSNLFDINATTGVVNFTANDSDFGNYTIEICVSDNGISPHPNSSLCNDSVMKTTCETISLTVTAENRPPEITSYYPEQLVFAIYEGQTVEFNITKYDPDGTIPSTYWYKNNALVKFGEDNYTFTTTYGDAGTYYIKALVSDGQYNDSVQWNVTVLAVSILQPSVGGGGISRCAERWVCTDWSECQNVSIIMSNLTDELYKDWLEQCSKLMENINMSSEQCGIQIRECEDASKCWTFLNKPDAVMACRFYPTAPSCFDGIRNCHEGACEILVDCGGSCPKCSIEIPRLEIPESAKKRVAVCGDKSCHITEMFSCANDCYVLWIMWVVAIILVLLVVLFMKRKKNKSKNTKNWKKKH